ncbi:histidine kinase [Burkholderiaceae bacterium DAT-1]|nr:histidine kinase [Burkholderiaceae bacterium DAT-1]
MEHLHPLHFIAPLRRGKYFHLFSILKTLIFGCLVGCVFFLTWVMYYGWPAYIGRVFVSHMVMATCISLSIHGLISAAVSAFPRFWERATHRTQMIAHAALSLMGVTLGYPVGMILSRVIVNGLHSTWHDLSIESLRSIAIAALMACVIIAISNYVNLRDLRSRERLAREQEQRATSERHAMEAELRMLQAQIEPHFLYNTLGGVVSLIEIDPTRARIMLERFIDYLRASLNASRHEHATLADELKTIRALLDILALRMGARLRYRIEVADELLSHPCPPMLIQPLVENAIKHGLEPKIEGGEVCICARQTPGQLIIEISDTGMGLDAAPTSGTRVGLSNLRQRLHVLFGKQASLQLIPNAGPGVTAKIVMPFEETLSP